MVQPRDHNAPKVCRGDLC